ncbi:trypsin [Leisingera sp. ANG-M1]|uniref:trypsin-like serine peptidase n=1 Tax=Leisingera sp. ANG-M1 TaxID=1577895 RepID=UPI00057C6C51|nr:S1 family peptidase [Leisingera sp. ANG-M1]KIC12275.1 trypsin [Leisingera sp. ANG-M1]
MRRLLGIAAAALITCGAGNALAGGGQAQVQSVPGWEAVGRLNISGKAMCTGSLIAPDLVLTAAHCLYNPQNGRAVNPRRIKFEAGLNGRQSKAQRKVVKAVQHPGYEHRTNGRAQTGYDLAVLRLDRPISPQKIRPLALAAAPGRGDSVDVLFYSYHKATTLNRQNACQVLAARQAMLVTTCLVDFGASGSPVLQLQPGRPPRLVSVISAKARMGGKRVSIATGVNHALHDLMRKAG